MEAEGLGEAFQLHLANIRKDEGFAETQFPDHIRDENLAGLGKSAHPRREVDCGAEQVLVFGDRLARAQADADFDGLDIAIIKVVSGKPLLDRHRTLDSLTDRQERGKNAVAHVLDLGSGVAVQRVSDHRVVCLQDAVETLVPSINPGRAVKNPLGLVASWSLDPPFATTRANPDTSFDS